MFTLTRILACTFVVAGVVALAACSNPSTGHGTASTGPASSAVSSGAIANSTAPSSLEITSWGPDSTKAGVAFNKQPDGSAALWIRVNQPLSGDVAAIEFNGVLLQGTVSGNLVTAGVPADLYAKPGSFKVEVIARKGDRSEQSNAVTFTVK